MLLAAITGMVAALGLVWQNLSERIKYHDALCAEDRQELRELKEKVIELTCSLTCSMRQPMNSEQIIANMKRND